MNWIVDIKYNLKLLTSSVPYKFTSQTHLLKTPESKEFTFNALGFIVLFLVRVLPHLFYFIYLFQPPGGTSKLQGYILPLDWAFRLWQRQEALLSNAAFVSNSSQKRVHTIPQRKAPNTCGFLFCFGLAAVWRFFLQKNKNKRKQT